MTLREELKKKLEDDCIKNPLKIWNKNNLQLKWNSTEKLYTGIDSKGAEWIAALQHTTVPIFSVRCTNLQRKNDAEVNCGAINFIAICDGDIVRCRKCDKDFTIKLNIPKSSKAYKILENLDK